MARISIKRELRKGKMTFEFSEILGPILHRRTKRGKWLNIGTGAIQRPKNAPVHGKSPHEAGRFRKVRAIQVTERFIGGSGQLVTFLSGHVSKVRDKIRF